ncbi:MAG: rhodanese-like domain-containing protein [Flavobacteriales bacterium]|nr:rhodanese-like domain-containing protein [Flavobacteriales bacterium]
MRHLKTVIFFVFFLLILNLEIYTQIIRVTPDRFADIIADSSIQKLDVRTEVEYEIIGHIKGFIQINGNSKNFEKKVLQTLNPNLPVAVYCMSGHRSTNACKKLERIGFKKIYELDGGIIQWIAIGGKIE